MKIFFQLSLLWMMYMKTNGAMVMRNNALMSKMVSHFQKDKNLSHEPPDPPEPPETHEPHESKPGNVLILMQNVLCKNFPSIPCEVIAQDNQLRKLIEKSIQQIKYKKLSMDKTTPLPGYHLTLFPVMNSEDLSNFLQFSDTGYYAGDKGSKKQKKSTSIRKGNSEEKKRRVNGKIKKDSKRTTVFNGRKKIRKFYPHKIKYKDKNNKNIRKDFGDYSEDKLSMSVEVPDMMTPTKKHHHMSFKRDPAASPVWRIDYMKHGEPNINMFGTESDRLKGKLIKAGPNVIVDENVLEQAARHDVLHPDVYIKKNFVRKNSELNSEALE